MLDGAAASGSVPGVKDGLLGTENVREKVCSSNVFSSSFVVCAFSVSKVENVGQEALAGSGGGMVPAHKVSSYEGEAAPGWSG